MNRQTKTNKPCSGYKEKRTVKNEKPQLMQGVETNTAATWIVYRNSDQVINIYDHCRDH